MMPLPSAAATPAPRPTVAFLGSDAVALPLLRWLRGAEGRAVAELTHLYTMPDRPTGRGLQTQPNALKQWALAEGVTVVQPAKIDAEATAAFAAQGHALGIVLAYGHLLPDAFLAAPRHGIVNLHGSLLPAYRGASPIETALADGITTTGWSLMRLVRRLDAGPVCATAAIAVDPATDDAPALYERLAEAAVPLLAAHLPALVQGTAQFVPQDEARATYCRKLDRDDARLDWAAPADVLARRFRALSPWPGATATLLAPAGTPEVTLKIGGMRAAAAGAAFPAAAPGTVLAEAGREGLPVATGAGRLWLTQLQRPGGRMLPAAEFVRGFALPPGTLFRSFPLAPLVSPTPFPRKKVP